MLSMRNVLAVLMSVATLVAAPLAYAQAWPARPIRLVVPYPPGGGADFVARLVAGRMGEGLGQTFVIENRPGASGMVAAESVVKSPADGYTLFLGDLASLSLNPVLYAKLPYDPFRDFEPVTRVVRAALMLVVPADSPVKSPRDLVEHARAHPGKLNYGIPGVGSPHHLTMELFLLAAGARITQVAYKGAAPAVQEMVASRLDTMFVDLGSGGPQIRAGKIRALAVGNRDRLPQFADVPTVAESGYADFEAFAWTGFVVPVNTPRDVIARLGAEYAKAVADPGVRQKLAEVGFEPLPGPPEVLAQFMKSEQAKWTRVIREANIKVE